VVERVVRAANAPNYMGMRRCKPVEKPSKDGTVNSMYRHCGPVDAIGILYLGIGCRRDTMPTNADQPVASSAYITAAALQGTGNCRGDGCATTAARVKWRILFMFFRSILRIKLGEFFYS
jgi:hypothetical protein